jgi:branched-chain amino acid transport system ATP-binding protein
MSAMLAIDGLTARCGAARVLKGVSFAVRKWTVTALMGNPLLLMLDEPSEGIAPRIEEQMAKAILDLKRKGLSIPVSEQNLHFATLIADEAVILERGLVRYGGTFADLIARPDVRDAYLAV